MIEDVAVSSVSICTASFTDIRTNKLAFVYCLENRELKYRGFISSYPGKIFLLYKLLFVIELSLGIFKTLEVVGPLLFIILLCKSLPR